MWCIVNLPNGTQQAVKWDPKAIGQECLEQVCKALGIICEMEYFGLEHWSPNQKESRTRQWINLRNRLSGDSGSSGIQLMLALRVKFWVPVHFILQENVRNLFYMQAKIDLLEGRLNALDWTNAAKLAALLCQADGIRFNEMSLKAKCPIKMKKDYELMKQQQQQLLLQQQQQQQQQASHSHSKEKKDKEYVSLMKKRRLSKQKSVENIEHHSHHHGGSCHLTGASSSSPAQSSNHLSVASAVAAVAVATVNYPSTSQQSLLNSQSYSLSTPNGVGGAGASHSHSHSQSQSPTSAISSSSASASSSPTNSSTNSPSPYAGCETIEDRLAGSPLRIYLKYIVRPFFASQDDELPEDFLRQIAIEHSKLWKLKMTSKSAKYWLLKEIQELPGYGEEIFNGFTTTEPSIRCDIAVGAQSITVCRGEDKISIPFSAIAAAKSFRRNFKLEYVDDHNDRRDLEIKLPKHAIAAGLYRSITERHAFYVCDKVRGVVTNQFTRDLKGTIASMFKEDTELGKRYVFDIQHTCREVHEQARRTLHERGIEISADAVTSSSAFDEYLNLLPKTANSSLLARTVITSTAADDSDEGGAAGGAIASCSGLSLSASSSMAVKLDLVIREKEEREAAIERCVDTRISEAMTCKVCFDRSINTMFDPCCHVMACDKCAARCPICPNCRVKVTNVVKIYLPPELRTSQSGSTSTSNDSNPPNTPDGGENDSNAEASTSAHANGSAGIGSGGATASAANANASASNSTPKLTTAA